MTQIIKELTAKNALPTHIGIIMDGNGRWAKKRGLPRQVGHRYGAAAFSNLVDYCQEIGIRYLTAYMFSTENWKRPQAEVDAIMNLLREYISEVFEKNQSGNRKNYRTHFIGERVRLAPDIVENMARVEALSQDCTGICVNIALNYGGRSEIVHAAQQAANNVSAGLIKPEDITEEYLSGLMFTAGQPDPDLIIRPSGEQRTSNFLIWQSAYSEYVFMDVLWPDFKPDHLDKALMEYAKRSRRFGGI
nr:polyprenyl diphosphate synthase [Acetanaerobacterium elongatum]